MCQFQERCISHFHASNTFLQTAQARSVLIASRLPARTVWTGLQPLSEDDPDLFDIIKREKKRQKGDLELIASEVP